MTGMYSVLEKRRAGEKIDGKDKEIYDAGLVGILLDIHNRIDAAVAKAYGIGVEMSDEDILHYLVDLNRARAAKELAGHVRWLRPDYQNPAGRAAQTRGQQVELDVGTISDAADKAPWPKSLLEQIAAVRQSLSELGEATPEQVARQFKRARAKSVKPLLESPAALGQAQITGGGRFAA